jgi:hypothetical protein
MNHRIRLALAALAAAGSVLGVTAAPAQARAYEDSDHRHCVSHDEWQKLGYMNPVRRSVIEQRFEVRGIRPANQYVNPTNPHLYPVAYRVCGRHLDEQVLVIMYRKTSNSWYWAFRLNRVLPLPPPHAAL